MGGSGSTMDASVTNYATNNEVSGTGYTAKGATLTRVDPSSSGTTAFTDFANATFSSSTITARGAVIFNDDASNDASVIVLEEFVAPLIAAVSAHAITALVSSEVVAAPSATLHIVLLAPAPAPPPVAAAPKA